MDNYLPWIISLDIFQTRIIYLHAHPQVMYYNFIKVHQYLFIRLGVVRIWYMDRLNDGWTDWWSFLYIPQNFVSGEYKLFLAFAFVGSAWSFSFFIPATMANDLWFRRISIPHFIHYIFVLSYLFRKSQYFPF